MKPTEAEALKQAMSEELDNETYEKIIERADDIRADRWS